MDSSKKNRCAKKLLNLINKMAQEKVNNAPFDKTEKGVVKSIAEDNKSAIVIINGYDRTCRLNPTCNISVGQVVQVIYEKNDRNRLYVSPNSSTFYNKPTT